MPELIPLEIPAVWRGAELMSRDDWTLCLTEKHLEELDSALQSTFDTPCDSIGPHNFVLPTLGAALLRVQNDLENGSGATMIRGFPSGQYSQDQVERIFFGMMSHVGTAVSQSAKGERMFHVRDEGFGENDPKARGPNTSKGLSFHTDRCDVISFLCLRQAKSGGANQIVSSPKLYNEILQRRPDLLAELVQPFYYKRHNVDTANQRSYCLQPIFSIYDGHFAANLLRVLIDRAYAMPDVPDMTLQQREALDFVQEVAEDESIHVTFRQVEGDILLLNNWLTLHRRSAFEDHQQLELRRHLLRIWLSVPNSRPLAPAFEANYGATAAGALRGGMRPQTNS
ncbi:MAG: hypothetical protein ACI9G1_004046 [Pirellulaceae bacterium]|jgi:hypothetical protein